MLQYSTLPPTPPGKKKKKKIKTERTDFAVSASYPFPLHPLIYKQHKILTQKRRVGECKPNEQCLTTFLNGQIILRHGNNISI